MEEKRKHKRLDLYVDVQLERLDEEGVTTLKYVQVDVTDISRSGIGFNAKTQLRLFVAKRPQTDIITELYLSE